MIYSVYEIPHVYQRPYNLFEILYVISSTMLNNYYW